MADPDFNIGPKPLDIGSLINMARGAQRLQSESAMGDIYAGAAGPDGIDPSKLGTPENMRRAGVGAPELAQRAQALTMGQKAIDKQQLDNTRLWWQVQDAAMYPLLNDPDLSHDKVLDAIHKLVGHQNSALKGGMFTPQMGLDLARQTYGPDGNPMQQDGLRKLIGQGHTRVIDALQNSEYIKTGVFPPGHPYEGREMFTTRAGAPVAQGDIGAGAAGPGAAPYPSGGAYNPPPHMAPQPRPGPGVPRGAVPMAPPLGTEQSTDQMMAGNAREANYRQEITPWEEALKDVQKLKSQGFSFGPGAKGRQEFQSFLHSLSPQLAAKYAVDPEKLRLFADASKYLTQATNARAAQGLHGSDMQLGAMISGNPNVDINSMSIEDTVKMAIQLRRLQYAQHYVASQAGPTGYSKAAANFPTEYDQNAFGMDLITQAEHAKLIKGLKRGTPEYERFNKSVKAANDSKVMFSP